MWFLAVKIKLHKILIIYFRWIIFDSRYFFCLINSLTTILHHASICSELLTKTQKRVTKMYEKPTSLFHLSHYWNFGKGNHSILAKKKSFEKSSCKFPSKLKTVNWLPVLCEKLWGASLPAPWRKYISGNWSANF